MAQVGRPSEYTPELIALAQDYLTTYKTKYGHLIPSAVGLCQAINRSKTTIYRWAEKDHPEFRDILEQINEMQEIALASNGLDGTFNSTITKLMLTKHGYSDKVEQELTGKDGGPVQISKIELVPLTP